MSNKPVVISLAPLGAGTQKKQTPHVPIKPAEVAADAVKCCKVGASIVHIHVRDDNDKGIMDKGRFIATTNAIREALAKEKLDMCMNITSSGASWSCNESGDTWSAPFTDEDRYSSLDVLLPEIVSFDCGSMNWANNRILVNAPAFLEKLAKKSLELNIQPEIEIFDAGMMGNAEYYIKQGMVKTPAHYQFIMGTPGGIGATVKDLDFLVSMLPAGASWSVAGIGKHHVPMMLAALAMGADGIRVGLEDNIYYSKGELATNLQLVERAAELCKIVGRGVATAQEAREIFHLTKKI